jgi:MAE_28990/MAE_18760-like HEPN
MFDNLSANMQAQIDTIAKIVKMNRQLRNIAIQEPSTLAAFPSLQDLSKVLPTEEEWRAYEHCATVSRLYAVYESFVENLIENWVVELPRLVPMYSDLDKNIQCTHIDNVARILKERNKQRFSELPLDRIISGLFNGVTGNQTYELLVDAFIIHERNLRTADLEELFRNAGIHPNAWNWVKNNHYVQNFIDDNIGGENTAEGLLKQLIDYRNDAAHGDIIDVTLSSSQLLEFCEFILAICKSLSELVTYQVLLKEEKQGNNTRQIGTISEWFKKPQAGVVTISNVKLKVGDSLFLASDKDCRMAQVMSLQINDTDKIEVEALSDIEVGIAFNIDGRSNLKLYQRLSP